jgi:hypothetical protein
MKLITAPSPKAAQRRHRAAVFRALRLGLLRLRQSEPEQQQPDDQGDEVVDAAWIGEVVGDLLQAERDDDAGPEVGGRVPEQHRRAGHDGPLGAGRVDHEGEEHRVEDVCDQKGDENAEGFDHRVNLVRCVLGRDFVQISY